MLRWERVPILGNNPVFCFEARRIWTKRTAQVCLVLMVVLGLVSWAAEPRLRTALQRLPSARLMLPASRLVSGVTPPSLSAFRGASTTGVFRGEWGPYSHAPCLLLLALWWVGGVGSQYFVPTLTAISLAGDRAGGRLGPLLASRMPLNAILIGKLMAPALPFGLLLLGGAILLGPPAVIGGAISAETVLYVVVLALPSLFVTGMVGLRVGASARHTTAAVGGSLVIVLLVLPGLHGTMYYLVLLQLLRPVIEASRTQQAWWQLAAVATHVVFSGLIFAALWFSTKRALARAAE